MALFKKTMSVLSLPTYFPFCITCDSPILRGVFQTYVVQSYSGSALKKFLRGLGGVAVRVLPSNL